jgi:hypothetical protein
MTKILRFSPEPSYQGRGGCVCEGKREVARVLEYRYSPSRRIGLIPSSSIQGDVITDAMLPDTMQDLYLIVEGQRLIRLVLLMEGPPGDLWTYSFLGELVDSLSQVESPNYR